MIQCTGLSLDDEAGFYLSTFFHKVNVMPGTTIVQPKIQRSKSETLTLPKTICYRCGKLGHMSSSCTGDLPKLEDLENELEKDFQYVYKRVIEEGQYLEDELGVYSDVNIQNSIPADSNWKNGTFCLNCGQKGGHQYGKCPHIGMQELADEMKHCIGPGSNYTESEIEEFFLDLW
ncbi:Zinc knuckle family protein [Histomonas meleagridis]|uniref:Zinc knuckle family protein n=1 Tax=Histomonas meleagridis TaxID=135588 RepID=UPI00355A3FD8|nr:Zinc knuckle family protein [Histomonas meleagridis]KAH0806431.1 Zinc knuckle family protein [Histomonas meleagridis]